MSVCQATCGGGCEILYPGSAGLQSCSRRRQWSHMSHSQYKHVNSSSGVPQTGQIDIRVSETSETCSAVNTTCDA